MRVGSLPTSAAPRAIPEGDGASRLWQVTMRHPAFSKWIEGSRPGDAVSSVAREALRGRLAAVQHYLPLAAENAGEDVEYVHQLRVSTRRSMAALKLFEGLLPRKRSRWLRDQLRDIRRAAGAARDCDVMRARYGLDEAGELPRIRQRLEAARHEAQPPIVAVHQRLSRPPRLDDRVQELLQRLRSHPRDMPGQGPVRFDAWARFHLRPLVDKFFRAAPGTTSDLPALHRFRIRGKQLRYAMELLAGAFAEEFRGELYPQIETLQDHLGRINDYATGTRQLQDWLTGVDDLAEVRQLAHLLQQELEGLDAAIEEFSRWWTPRFATELQSRFERLLADSAIRLYPESPAS